MNYTIFYYSFLCLHNPYCVNEQVPYDVLNKKFRLAQKTLDREVCHVTTAVSELERVLFTDNRSASHISSLLGGVVEKLSSFKRKVRV